jgi:hypothetical protein
MCFLNGIGKLTAWPRGSRGHRHRGGWGRRGRSRRRHRREPWGWPRTCGWRGHPRGHCGQKLQQQAHANEMTISVNRMHHRDCKGAWSVHSRKVTPKASTSLIQETPTRLSAFLTARSSRYQRTRSDAFASQAAANPSLWCPHLLPIRCPRSANPAEQSLDPRRIRAAFCMRTHTDACGRPKSCTHPRGRGR